MFLKNEKLVWSLMEGLDKVLENTHTNEEWDKYHLLRRSIESIYRIEVSTIRYGLSGEIIRHVPAKEVQWNEIFNYLNES